ncbi:hypothetical protein HK405_007707, partial [Cladochytrium tenue]
VLGYVRHLALDYADISVLKYLAHAGVQPTSLRIRSFSPTGRINEISWPIGARVSRLSLPVHSGYTEKLVDLFPRPLTHLEISAVGKALLARNRSSLRSLTVLGWDDDSAVSDLIEFFDSKPPLRVLSFSRMNISNAPAILRLGESNPTNVWPPIRILTLHVYSASCLAILAGVTSTVRSLRLEFMHAYEGHETLQLALNNAGAAGFLGLRDLAIVQWGGRQLSAAQLSNVVACCPNLETLDLRVKLESLRPLEALASLQFLNVYATLTLYRALIKEVVDLVLQRDDGAVQTKALHAFVHSSPARPEFSEPAQREALAMRNAVKAAEARTGGRLQFMVDVDDMPSNSAASAHSPASAGSRRAAASQSEAAAAAADRHLSAIAGASQGSPGCSAGDRLASVAETVVRAPSYNPNPGRIRFTSMMSNMPVPLGDQPWPPPLPAIPRRARLPRLIDISMLEYLAHAGVQPTSLRLCCLTLKGRLVEILRPIGARVSRLSLHVQTDDAEGLVDLFPGPLTHLEISAVGRVLLMRNRVSLRSLTVLGWNDSAVSDLIEFFDSKPPLRALSFSRLNVRGASWQAILAGVASTVQSLRLGFRSFSKILPHEALQLALSNARRHRLSCAAQLSDVVACCPNLETLDLRVNVESLRPLEALASLRFLTLRMMFPWLTRALFEDAVDLVLQRDGGAVQTKALRVFVAVRPQNLPTQREEMALLKTAKAAEARTSGRLQFVVEVDLLPAYF